MDIREKNDRIDEIFFKGPILSCLYNKLIKAGVDLAQNNYKSHPAFIFMEDTYRFSTAVPDSWLVERLLIGESRLEQIYGCYDLRISRKLTDAELTGVVWMSALLDKFPDSVKTTTDIYDNVYGKKDGLADRLKELGINVTAFSDESEKVRLLFFLYCFENGNSMYLKSFFSKPTLENVDNFRVGDITRNGELMRKLKNSVARGILDSASRTIQETLVGIILQWQDELIKVHEISQAQTPELNIQDLQRINNNLDQLMIFISNSENHLGKYQHSLLETFYLKLCQHENVGRQRDLLDLQTRIKPVSEMSTAGNIAPLICKHVQKNDISLYIKENRSLLARIVFNKQDITSNEYAKFDRMAADIPKFIAVLSDNTFYKRSKTIPAALIVSYLLVANSPIVKERLPNPFYRHETSDQKTLNAERKNGIQAFRKNQIALIFLVIRQMDVLLGRTQERSILDQIEIKVDKIIRKILSCNSTGDMLRLHDFFLQQFQVLSMQQCLIDNEFQKFRNALNNRYDILFPDQVQYDCLWGTLFGSDFTLSLASRINEYICQTEARGHKENYPIFFGPPEGEECWWENFIILFTIDPSAESITLVDFYFVFSEKEKQFLLEHDIY